MIQNNAVDIITQASFSDVLEKIFEQYGAGILKSNSFPGLLADYCAGEYRSEAAQFIKLIRGNAPLIPAPPINWALSDDTAIISIGHCNEEYASWNAIRGAYTRLEIWAQNVEIGRHAFHSFDEHKLREVIFHGHVKDILYSAFEGNELTSIVFEQGVEEIGESAFALNPFTELGLPEDLKFIGAWAFEEIKNKKKCAGIEKITIGNNVNFHETPRCGIFGGEKAQREKFKAFMNCYVKQYDRKAGTYAYKQENVWIKEA